MTFENIEDDKALEKIDLRYPALWIVRIIYIKKTSLNASYLIYSIDQVAYNTPIEIRYLLNRVIVQVIFRFNR